MDRPGERPFRATVYLPGHDESGRSPVVRRVSAATEEGLGRSLAYWKGQGYRVKAYENVALDFGEEDEGGEVRPPGEVPQDRQDDAPDQGVRP